MDTPESAQKSVELAGQELMERPISIEIARGKGTATGALSEPSNTLFMGNLSFQITEENVREEFGEFGEVTGVRWGEEKETGKFRG
jgi:nucleolin